MDRGALWCRFSPRPSRARTPCVRLRAGHSFVRRARWKRIAVRHAFGQALSSVGMDRSSLCSYSRVGLDRNGLRAHHALACAAPHAPGASFCEARTIRMRLAASCDAKKLLERRSCF
ncbi:hypothetical protein HMPREF1155_0137 [Slackia sp. CM382]|nr:hypothetical protein HMPREF1155_0137 [Slackia sp. CM382]